MSHREPPLHNGLRLRDLDWDDDHHVWDIRLDELRATSWTETENNVWERSEYEIRRVDGQWQYYEDIQKVEHRKKLLEEALERRKGELTHLYPPATQADILKDNMRIEREIKTAEASWINFHPETSELIESEWRAQRGES